MKTKHCLITGGTSGVGLEFVKIFIKKDFFIHIISRNEEKFKYEINKLPKKKNLKFFFIKQIYLMLKVLTKQ